VRNAHRLATTLHGSPDMSYKPACSSKPYARHFLQFFAASLKNPGGAILNNVNAAFILVKLTASAGAFI